MTKACDFCVRQNIFICNPADHCGLCDEVVNTPKWEDRATEGGEETARVSTLTIEHIRHGEGTSVQKVKNIITDAGVNLFEEEKTND
jgi:hypothetical protein